MRRRRLFAKEIRSLMFGFGDVGAPLQDSVDVVDELLEWYIVDLAVRRATGKVKTSDFLTVLANDPKKLARAHELLKLDRELRMARATFNVEEVSGLAARITPGAEKQ